MLTDIFANYEDIAFVINGRSVKSERTRFSQEQTSTMQR